MSAPYEDWTNWRGPNYNGATSGKNLPVKFSKTENIAWQTELPGPGAGTPIIVGDRVFLSSARIENAASGKGQLLALCLDRKTGKTIWERNAGSGYWPNGDGADYRLDNRGTYASPSPVTDGETVVFFYGNGDLVGFNMKGDKLWARNIQKDYGDFTFQWTFSATPTLYEDKLYLARAPARRTRARPRQGEQPLLHPRHGAQDRQDPLETRAAQRGQQGIP